MRVLPILPCLAASVAAYAPSAHAQVACDSLPNPLYLQVGDTQEPLVKTLGRALRDDSDPITLIYVTSGSCANIAAIYDDTTLKNTLSYVPTLAEDAAWVASKPSLPCTPPAEGHLIDLANSALFVESCKLGDPPATVHLHQGPVQGYGFIVPQTSSQAAITAEEAYFVFGFGEAGMVSPWTDEESLFIRPVTKSTLLAMAAVTTGLDQASKWRGQRLDKSSEVLSGVAQASDPEQAIGILGVELYDGKRNDVKLLAFRGYDQKHAYFPDSSATAFDKRNVRDGHYLPWSPTVWMTTDASDADGRARADRVVDLILGRASATADFEPLEKVIGVGLVPDCAMSVTRSVEGGDLSLYAPDEPCGCYYESQVSQVTPAACTPCSEDAPCEEGECRHGYCEVR